MQDQGVTRLPRWFVPQDIDGFFGLGLNNLIQILAVVSLTQGVLNFPPEIVYGRLLPSLALSLIVGNFYYSWLAYQQGKQEERDDLTALPYGINTISLFVYIFLVMVPVRSQAMANGASSQEAAELAWQAGMVACLGSGIIELLGAGIGHHVRRLTPRAALLGTLGGLAITFLGMDYLLQTYAHPVVAMVPLAIVLLTYFGKVQFRIPGSRYIIPGGLLAVLLGVALAWLTGLASWESEVFASNVEVLGFYVPQIWIGELWEQREILFSFFTIILPMGLFNLVGSLQILESAQAAGDRYPTSTCLAVNGVGSIVAALFGSCFPTTLYIGHPSWKEMGARVGYSWLNGVIMGLLCLTGAIGLFSFFIPIESGMAIILWIGIAMVVQSMTAIPKHHIPAVVMALMPGIAGWMAGITKNGMQVAGMGTPDAPFLDNAQEIVNGFQESDIYITGAFALEQGVVFSSMILGAMMVYIIDREFGKAAIWSLGAAILAWVGLIHSYEWTMSDTVLQLGWGVGGQWATGYVLVAIVLLYAQWQKPKSQPTEADENLHKQSSSSDPTQIKESK